MEKDSTERCSYITESHLNELRKSFDRMASHAALISNLMDPSHKIGKALRSIEWLEEASNERSLNAYGGRPNVPWYTVRDALEKAHIYGEALYVTLIPGKLELHNSMDELILEFVSKEDYYCLITRLKLTIRKE